MAISEIQLATWAKQGQTAQFTSTYDNIKAVLEHDNSPYSLKNFNIFLQGSYKNDTNIYGDSDLDIIINLKDIFYYDLSFLPDIDKKLFLSNLERAEYSLTEFKDSVLIWLIKNYGSDVIRRSKAIMIRANANRRDADILVSAELRRYLRFKDWNDFSYEEGIRFLLPDQSHIDNFPSHHSKNCTTKHQMTNNWFKPTVRIYKNLRNKLINDGRIKEGLAPSYFLEGLLYNVPLGIFGGSEQENFYSTLNWLVNADRSRFVCANEMYRLFDPKSPVMWRIENCDQFLRATTEYWNSYK